MSDLKRWLFQDIACGHIVVGVSLPVAPTTEAIEGIVDTLKKPLRKDKHLKRLADLAIFVPGSSVHDLDEPEGWDGVAAGRECLVGISFATQHEGECAIDVAACFAKLESLQQPLETLRALCGGEEPSVRLVGGGPIDSAALTHDGRSLAFTGGGGKSIALRMDAASNHDPEYFQADQPWFHWGPTELVLYLGTPSLGQPKTLTLAVHGY